MTRLLVFSCPDRKFALRFARLARRSYQLPARQRLANVEFEFADDTPIGWVEQLARQTGWKLTTYYEDNADDH